MKAEEIKRVVKERYSKAAQTYGAGKILAVVRAQPHLAPGLPNGRVFTLRKIWHLSRNSLSSFREVVVIL